MHKKNHNGKRSRSGSFAAAWIILSLLLLLAAAFVLFRILFVRVDGRFIRRDSESVDMQNTDASVDTLLKLDNPASLDLRGNDVSAADFERLSAAYPDCDIRWDVPLSDGQRFDSESESIALRAVCPEDVPLFAFFPRLKSVDAGDLDAAAALHALALARPDVAVDWTVSLGGERLDPESAQIRLTGDISAPELTEKLAYFDALEDVTVEKTVLSVSDQLALRAAYPRLRFHWPVSLGGKTLRSDDSALDLSGRQDVNAEELISAAPLFAAPATLDLTGCSLSQQDMLRVAAAWPDTDVVWTFSLYGVEVCSTDEEIDLSGIEIRDTSPIEEALPAMRHLSKVIMSDCGISDEDMDALNKRHEDVRFVWTVYFGKLINDRRYSLRTDADHFISSLHFGYETDREDLNDETVQPLKYCTDIVALDLGHQHFTNLEFLRDMKKLRFLIIADGDVEDISPLADLPELYFAELFLNPFHDISPLLECKNLRHLNICHCDIYDYEDLAQMVWLERLWFMSIYMTVDEYYYLRDILPDTEKVIALMGTATGGTWRYVDAYYEMRDLLGAYYMAGGTEKPK